MGNGGCKGDKQPEVQAPPQKTAAQWEDPKQAHATAQELDRPVAERAQVDGGAAEVAKKREFINPNARVCGDVTGITNWNDLKDWTGSNSVDMAELMREAQTGDVILFDNDVMLGTCLISCLTRSDWDHTGIVIRFPEPIGVRLLEAVAPRVVMDKLDVVVSQVKSGAMYWRQLKKRDGSALWTPEEENNIRLKAHSLFDRPYENQMGEMVQAWKSGEATTWDDASGIQGLCCDKRYADAHKKKVEAGVEESADGKVNKTIVEHETEQRLFCSECVAAVYKHAGLISDEVEACNYLPKDFSTDPHASLALNELFELMPEKKILHHKAGSVTAVDANGLPIQQAPAGGSGGRPQTFVI